MKTTSPPTSRFEFIKFHFWINSTNNSVILPSCAIARKCDCHDMLFLVKLFMLFILFSSSHAKAQSIAPCTPTPGVNAIVLSSMFGQSTYNTSRQLLSFRTSNNGIPQANFLLLPSFWWSSNAIANWMPAGAFGGITTNNTFGTGTYPSTLNLGEVYIDGDFFVNEDLFIQYTEIKMTQNARIIIEPGHVLVISCSWLHACDETSPMWKGIEVQGGGYLQIVGNTKIEDALIAVKCYNNSFLDVNQSIFNRNNVGVSLNGPVVRGYTQGSVSPGVKFDRVSFTCVDPSCLTASAFNPLAPYISSMLNPPFSNKHSDVGIILNNISQNYTTIIGLTSTPQTEIYFVNQDIGISVLDSWSEIKNCRFFDINLNNGLSKTSGTAILVDAKYSTPGSSIPTVKCTIGDDLPSTLYDKCIFTNCRTGIFAHGASEISILNNDFIDQIKLPILLSEIRGGVIKVMSNSINNFDAQGLYITNCINNVQLNVNNNLFSLSSSSSTASAGFLQTGVFIKNSPIAFSGVEIYNNDFVNLRFGVYGNGVGRGRIGNNRVNFNKSWTTMAGKLHAGLWFDNCNDLDISYNQIQYLDGMASMVPAGSTIAQNLRGVTLKGVTNSTVLSNQIINCGRPIRCVDNILQTFFYCNTFDGCFDSWQVSSSDISTQGTAGYPVDNLWLNYPRSVSPLNQAKMSGNLKSLKDYFYRPVGNSSSTYIPLPNTCFNLTPTSTLGSGPCSNQLQEEDLQSIIDFVLIDSLDQLNDSIYQVEKARWTAYVAANDSLMNMPDYVNWYSFMQNSEAGIYARLLDQSYNRIDLMEALDQLNSFRLPEYELKRNLTRDALFNQMNDSLELPLDSISLVSLGQQPAWSSTNVVYLIRA